MQAKPTSSPPLPAPSREWLLHQLYEAAELEHNLMCTYLYERHGAGGRARDQRAALPLRRERQQAVLRRQPRARRLSLLSAHASGRRPPASRARRASDAAR